MLFPRFGLAKKSPGGFLVPGFVFLFMYHGVVAWGGVIGYIINRRINIPDSQFKKGRIFYAPV